MSKARIVGSASVSLLLISCLLPGRPVGVPSGGQAPRLGNVADRAYRDGVLRKVADLVESKYVLVDRAKGFADAFRTKCASGAYDAFTAAKDFAAKVNGDLIAISGDKHFNFRVIEASDAGEKPQSPLHHPVRYARLRMKENTGFFKLEWIEPAIGYVELRRFNQFGEAKDMVLAAMRFLAGADAIVIDVRENGGGSGDYLSSYFLPYPTQLSGSFARENGRLTESWTRKDIGMAPRTDVPVFLLIGPRTFSAAEAFAYDMQSRGRATLVGEPTKGGAHSVDVFPIDAQFEFYVSTERAVSPVTGGNWEGTGVRPDVSAPASQALPRAVELARKAGEAFGKAKQARIQRAVDEMQGYWDRVEGLVRSNRAAGCGPELDAIFRIARAAGLLSEFFIGVLAYNFQAPADLPLFAAILEKAIALYPESRDFPQYLADAYEKAGNRDLALGYYRKALELAPEDRNISRKIEELQRRR
jgi:hypothetical protein